MTRARSCRSRESARPAPPGAAILLLTVVILGAWSPHGATLPPVRYNAELRFNSRAIVPDLGDAVYLFGRTGRINMESFIWKPWFASVGGGFDFSWVDTFAKTRNETRLLGGDARVTMFPSSRFPTFGFVSVSDTRTDVESSQLPDRQVRTTRFGLRQSYQPREGGSRVAARIDRTIEEGTDDGRRATIDRGVLSGTLLTERQRFSGDLNIRSLSRDIDQEELFELVGTIRHNARPTDTVSVDSFATYTDTSSETALVNFKNRTFQANSLALWRPHRIPLTVSASARVTAAQRERDGAGSDNTSGNLAFGGDYLINRLTRVSGNVAVNFSDDNVSSTQGATLSYSPDALGLGSFTYNWFTSTSLANELGSSGGDRTLLGAQFGHGLTRARPFAGAPAWSLSLAGNNSISGSLDSINGAAATFGLSGSLGVSHASAARQSSLRLDATDSRSYGSSRTFASGDNSFQSINFNFDHRHELSRDSRWNVTMASGWNRQDFGGDATITKFSSMNLGYTDSRLFGVPRMLFRSQFTARTIDLFFSDLSGEENTDMRWENRLDYFIGKLETRLSATWSRVNARNGYSVLLTISRKFDGAF